MGKPKESLEPRVDRLETNVDTQRGDIATLMHECRESRREVRNDLASHSAQTLRYQTQTDEKLDALQRG
ncbi:MAG: hypothetical protein ACJA1R_000856, partial [Flavobacteriales bacterium]